MKTIGKSTILLLLVMFLASCDNFSSRSTMTPSIVMETEVMMLLPTITNTEFYTPIPTATLTPTRRPTTATATTELVPFTSFGTIFMTGLDNTSEKIHPHPDDIFHLFLVPSSEIASFHFAMGITVFHFTKNGLTPTPTAIPTAKWKLFIYRYRAENVYANQPTISTNFVSVVTADSDRLTTSLSADVKMEDLQSKFGDCGAFTFQVMDEKGNIQQQSSFSINSHYLIAYDGGIKGNIKNGVTVGYPYSVNENETEFFHQDKFVLITGSQSGFYRLTYHFDFTNASGISAVTEQEKAASQLSIRFFPYRDDGNYSIDDSHPATGFLHAGGGYFIVDIPIDYMQENNSKNNKYYLQIIDGSGKIIKDEYFMFAPYIP